MVSVKATITICNRCGFGKEQPGTEQRIFALEQRYYQLDLCEQHADMFDRDLGRWTQLADEIDGPTKPARSEYFSKQRQEEVARVRELAERAQRNAQAQVFADRRAKEIEAQQAAEAEQRLRAGIPGAAAWRLSQHALERMQLRGFDMEEVLRTAATPEHTYRQSWRGPHIAIHVRSDCRIVVNAQTKDVITVIDRTKRFDPTVPKPTDLTLTERHAL